MKRSLLMLVVAAALLTTFAATAQDAATTTLNGEFIWNRGPTGPLEAVFTPTGDGTYEVSFHFEFRGEPHTYSGTANGSLTDGTLEGTVKNENRKRTFTFTGAFGEDGSYKGTHAEVREEEKIDTGTLTLKG